MQARGLAADQREIRVSGEKGDKPVRIVSLAVEVIVPGLSDRYKEGIVRAVNFCLLKNTLLTPPAIQVRLSTSNEALRPVTA